MHNSFTSETDATGRVLFIVDAYARDGRHALRCGGSLLHGASTQGC
jgi:hypothetical protein